MSYSKDQWRGWRDLTPNHADRKHLAYLKQTNADLEQINHVTGKEPKRWKK